MTVRANSVTRDSCTLKSECKRNDRDRCRYPFRTPKKAGCILAKYGEPMIRAILKKGKIEPLDELPGHWRDGQELTVEGGEPSDDPAEIKKWHKKLLTLSAH